MDASVSPFTTWVVVSLLILLSGGTIAEEEYYDKMRPCPENFPHLIGDTCYHIGSPEEKYTLPQTTAVCYRMRGVPANPRHNYDIGNLTQLAKEGFTGNQNQNIVFWTGFTVDDVGRVIDPHGNWIRARSEETKAMFDQTFAGFRPSMLPKIAPYQSTYDGHTSLYVNQEGSFVLSYNDNVLQGRLVCEHIGAPCTDPEKKYFQGQCLWTVSNVATGGAAVDACAATSDFPEVSVAVPIKGLDRMTARATHHVMEYGFGDTSSVLRSLQEYKPNCGSSYSYFMGRCYLMTTAKYGTTVDFGGDSCHSHTTPDAQMLGGEGGMDEIDAFFLRSWAIRSEHNANGDTQFGVWAKPFGEADFTPEHCMARALPVRWSWSQKPEVAPAYVEAFATSASNYQSLDIDAPCDAAKYQVVCSIPLHLEVVGTTSQRAPSLKDTFTGTTGEAWPACASVNKWWHVPDEDQSVVAILTPDPFGVVITRDGYGMRKVLMRTAEQCARLCFDHIRMYNMRHVWTFRTDTGVCFIFNVSPNFKPNTVLVDVPAASLPEDDQHFYVSGEIECYPEMNLMKTACEAKAADGWAVRNRGKETVHWSGHWERLDHVDCFKKMDGTFNYAEAKTACMADSIDVFGNAGFNVKGEILDMSGTYDASDRIQLAGDDKGVFWLPYKDEDSEGTFTYDQDFASRLNLEGSVKVIAPDYSQWFHWEPNNGRRRCNQAQVKLSNLGVPTASAEVECTAYGRILCKRPYHHTGTGTVAHGPYRLWGQTALCAQKPFAGDITCSFESSRWDRGHCNWEYAFESVDEFTREYQAPRDTGKKTWQNGNHFLKRVGPAHIKLQTRGDYNCTSSRGEADFGFMYKLTSGKVTVSKLNTTEFGHFKGGSENVLKVEEVTAETTEWTKLTTKLCPPEPQTITTTPATTTQNLGPMPWPDPKPTWKIAIEVEIADGGEFYLDDIGPCSFNEFYDEATDTCTTIYMSETEGAKLNQVPEMCGHTSFGGEPFMPENPSQDPLAKKLLGKLADKKRMMAAANGEPITGPVELQMWDGRYVANSKGERLFKQNGEIATEVVTVEGADRKKRCTVAKMTIDGDTVTSEYEAASCNDDTMMPNLMCSRKSNLEGSSSPTKPRSLGCFTVKEAADPDHTHYLMSVSFCAQVCKGKSKAIALVQDDKCFCADGLEKLTLLPATECYSPCEFNPTQTCGSKEYNANGLSAYDTSLFPGIADTCWDLFKLGVRPDGKKCSDFIDTSGNTFQCCLGSINPQGTDAVCSTPETVGIDGDCYSMEGDEAKTPIGFVKRPMVVAEEQEQVVEARRKKRQIQPDYEVHTGQPYFLAARTCHDKGGHLFHIDSDEELTKITEVLMEMSEFTELDVEIVTGVYHDLYASYTTLSSGEKINFMLPVAETTKGHSCFGLRRKASNELELELVTVSCLEPKLFICEFHGAGHPIARAHEFTNDALTLFEANTVKDSFESDSTMSFTTCLAFCQGKGAKTMAVQAQWCICMEESLADVGATDDNKIESCDFNIPCKGNPSQVCGCKKETESYALFSDIENMNENAYGFESCEELRRHGVFQEGWYKLKGQDDLQYCKNWPSICPKDYVFHAAHCLKVGNDAAAFDAVACPDGGAQYDGTLAAMHLKNAGLAESLSDVWNWKDEGANKCYDGTGAEAPCDEAKRPMCAMKVCPEDGHMSEGHCATLVNTQMTPVGEIANQCLEMTAWHQPLAKSSDATFHLVRSLSHSIADPNMQIFSHFDKDETGNDQAMCLNFEKNMEYHGTENYPMVCDEQKVKQFLCYRPVSCPLGSILSHDNTSCINFHAIMEGDEAQLPELHCKMQNAVPPSFPTQESANKFLLTLMDHLDNLLPPYPVDITQISIRTKPKRHPSRPLTLWNTREGSPDEWPISLEDFAAMTDDHAVEIKLDAGKTHAEAALITGASNPPTAPGVHFCQHLNQAVKCVDKAATEAAGFSPNGPLGSINPWSVHDGAQHCRHHGFYGVSWMAEAATDQPTTSCLSRDSLNLFEVARDNPAFCHTACLGQVCGAHFDPVNSYAIINPDFLPASAYSCEDVFMKNFWAFTTDRHYLNVRGEDTLTDCKYRTRQICRTPLILDYLSDITELVIDDVAIPLGADFLPFQIGYHHLRDYVLTPGGAAFTSATQTVSITFGKAKLIRELFLAWNVNLLEYKDLETDTMTTLKKSDGATDWDYTATGRDAQEVILPQAVHTKHIKLTLGFRDGDMDTLFMEIRGCEFDADSSGGNFGPYHNIHDGFVFEVFEDQVLDWDAANAFCAEKGGGTGHLAVIDTPEKQLAVEYATFAIGWPGDKKIMIGLKRDETTNMWGYANGKTVGQFGNPSETADLYDFSKNCTYMEAQEGLVLKWHFQDCINSIQSHPACEYPNPPDDLYIEEETDCLILPPDTSHWHSPSGSYVDAAGCAELCRSEVTEANPYQWAVYPKSGSGCFCTLTVDQGFMDHNITWCNDASNMDKLALVRRVWELGATCQAPPKTLDDKHLTLRKHHVAYKYQTEAHYDCDIGYAPQNAGDTFVLTCQNSGEWDKDPAADFASCQKVTCTAPDAMSNQTPEMGFKVDHGVWLGPGEVMAGTSFRATCPTNVFFDEDGSVDKLQATCGADGNWLVGHHMLCPSDDTSVVSCATLDLDQLACRFPDCESPETALNFLGKLSHNATEIKTAVFETVKVECKTPGHTYKITETETLDSVTVTCKYDEDTELSQWSWMDDNDVPQAELPGSCDIFCADDPPEEDPPTVTMNAGSWDGGHWGASLPSYSCHPNMAFALPFMTPGQSLNVKCARNADTGENEWHTQPPNGGDLIPGLPACNFWCDASPPFDDTKWNRTWTLGDNAIGAEAIYTCLGDGESFLSGIMYDSITMNCTRKQGTTDKGEWTWVDQGTKSTSLPECAMTPYCEPLLDALDQNRTVFESNGEYLKMDNTNFFVVEGLETLADLSMQIIGATDYTAKCAFQPNKFLIGDWLHSSLKFECQYDGSSASAKWVWHNPDGPGDDDPPPVDQDLPMCTARCEQDPAQGPVGVRNASWSGDRDIGTTVEYSCYNDELFTLPGNDVEGFKTYATVCTQLGSNPPQWDDETQLAKLECKGGLGEYSKIAIG